MSEKKPFQLKFPNTCALLFMITIFAAVLTWIIPAGEFDSETVGSTTRVIAGTFHYIDGNPQGPWDVLMATVGGFYRSAKLMTMIMFIGAGVYMLEQSRSFDIAFGSIAAKAQKKSGFIIFIIMALMSIGGAAGVLANPVVALVPIGILLAHMLGLDKATGLFIVYLGAYSGFNVGWANVSTIGVAHPIAELPMFSGFNVRVLFNIVNFIITFIFVMMYIRSIRKDPTKSLNYTPGMKTEEYMGSTLITDPSVAEEKLTLKHILSILAVVGGILAMVVGSINFKWSFDQFAATFLAVAIFIGLVNGWGVNGTTQRFLKGCSTLLTAAFVVGFANSISIVMTDGKILHTIVYALSIPISSAGSVLGANLMFFANLLINGFIPSGSGQAAAVMPLMVPIADLSGITRQVAVQAFQFGDGLSNCVFPTSGTLMGCLGIAGVSWHRYVKRFLPLVLTQIVLSIIALTILQSIGWTGL